MSSITETVIRGEVLTAKEADRLGELEQVVETGLTVFVKVGNALLEIRDSRLYRQHFETFEAYCRERWGLSRFYAHRIIDAAAVANNVLPMGNIPQTERQARPLTRLEPEVQREVWKEILAETPPEQITAKVVEEKAKAAAPLNEAAKAIKEELKPEPPKPAQQPMLPEPVKPKDPAVVAIAQQVKAGEKTVIEAAKAIQSPPSKADPSKMGYVTGAGKTAEERDSDDWHTPSTYVEAVRDVLGTIDLDPFSSVIANQAVKAARFLTVADNALTQAWGSGITAFLNPPYGRGVIDAAISKFCKELPALSAAVVLVNNATETQWFQSLLATCQAFCLVNHRIAFISPDNKNESGGVRGQVFFYFGDDYQVFAARFKTFGPVCKVLT